MGKKNIQLQKNKGFNEPKIDNKCVEIIMNNKTKRDYYQGKFRFYKIQN